MFCRHTDWTLTLEKQRKQYKDFLNEIIIEPGLKRCDAVMDDHVCMFNCLFSSTYCTVGSEILCIYAATITIKIITNRLSDISLF